MNTYFLVLGFCVFIIGFSIFFVASLFWGIFLMIISVVAVVAGLLMESVEDKVKRKLRVCKVCGRKISKWQAESLGLCQKCFERLELSDDDEK